MHQLNYFLLERLVAEWSPRLVGTAFVGAHTGRKGELVLRFGGGVWRVGFAQPGYLLPSAAPPKPRANARPFFESWWGQRVTGLSLHPGERLVRIALEGAELLLVLQGTRGNVLLVAAGQVRASFRRAATDVPYAEPAIQPIPANEMEWQARVAVTGGDRRRALPAFDRTLWQQADAEGAGWPALARVLERMRHGPIAVDAAARPPALRLGADVGHATATEALAAWARAYGQQQGLEGQRAAAHQALDEARATVARQAARLHDEQQRLSAQRSAEELGHLVLAQLHRFTPGVTRVSLEDFYQGGEVEVALQPGESGQALAERLYAQHRRDQARLVQLPELLAKLDARATRLSRAAEALAAVSSLKGLRQWQQRHETLLARVVGKAPESERRPYRRFRLGGYEVRVGRSAADNDALTLRHSRPHDLWLHARDVSGSHVVVVNPTRGPVPQAVVEQAAGLAAWFSRQRGATLATVSVTPRKYVRKGRHHTAGQVSLLQEQSLLVAPLDPARLRGPDDAAEMAQLAG